MNREQICHWVETYSLSPIHVDCATAVMLKILDGKCKMRENEKRVMELLYDAVRHFPGQVLDPALHPLIESARSDADDPTKTLIYEKRLLAETAISRPVMKGFKAMIRQQGLLDDAANDEKDI